METNNNNNEETREERVLRQWFRKEYKRLVTKLLDQGEEMRALKINNGVLSIILKNVDHFCAALSRMKRMESVHIVSGARMHQWPPLVRSDEPIDAWKKLCRALSRSSLTIKRLFLSPCPQVNGQIMALLVKSVPRAESIELDLPWHTSSSHDMEPLIQALIQHSCQDITILFEDRLHKVANTEEQNAILSAEPQHYFQNQDIFRQLLLLPNLKCLKIRDVLEFTEEDCMNFADILSTTAFQASKLVLRHCSFVGHHVVTSIRHFTSIKRLQIIGIPNDVEIMDTLCTSLALNETLEGLALQFDCIVENETMTNLYKTIIQHNTSLRHLAINDRYTSSIFRDTSLFRDNPLLVQEIQEILPQNYSLWSLGYKRAEFETILRLNRAGRMYVREDPTSKTACIDVLAQVNDCVDSMFFHLRENPVLFVDASSD